MGASEEYRHRSECMIICLLYFSNQRICLFWLWVSLKEKIQIRNGGWCVKPRRDTVRGIAILKLSQHKINHIYTIRSLVSDKKTTSWCHCVIYFVLGVVGDTDWVSLERSFSGLQRQWGITFPWCQDVKIPVVINKPLEPMGHPPPPICLFFYNWLINWLI